VEQDVAIETAVHRMEQDLIPTDTAPDFKRRRRYKAWGSVRHTPQIINDMMGKQYGAEAKSLSAKESLVGAKGVAS
jgi:hypothetical protein